MDEELDKPGEQLPSFRISASVVRQLGEELVSDELTAIMELVKNSYDADADWVKISINTEDKLKEDDLMDKTLQSDPPSPDETDPLCQSKVIPFRQMKVIPLRQAN